MKNFVKSKIKILLEELKKEPKKEIIKNIFIVLLGSFLLALGVEMFLIPMKVIAGGSSSMALIFSNLTNNVISAENFVTIIYWICFIIGLFTLGLRYSLKTLIVTISNPLFIYLFDFIIENTVINGHSIFSLEYWSDPSTIVNIGGADLKGEVTKLICFLMAVIIGPILEGVGISISMLRGGSSGGTDVFSLLINKYFKISIGLSGFIIDSVIILVGFFTINQFNLPATLFGIMAGFILSITIDKVFYAYNSKYMAFISSEKYQEINDYIIKVANRGSTLIKSKGGYSGKETYLIETCFDKDQYYDMQKEILKIDPNAFIRVIKSQEILGYGFTRNIPKVENNSSKKENINKEESKNETRTN